MRYAMIYAAMLPLARRSVLVVEATGHQERHRRHDRSVAAMH